MKKFIAVILFSSLFCISFAQHRVIENSINTQSVFVHTDKENYYPNDTIFFKAYIFDSQNKLLSGKCNLYVDLLYPSGMIREKGLLLQENGNAAGQFVINDTISGGIYILRAYTYIMAQAGDNYFFYKPINIITKDKFYYEKELFKKTKRYMKNNNSFILIPEGGKILLNLNNKIFISPENGINSKDFSFKVYKNNSLKYSSAGKSDFFYLKPQKTDKYRVIIEHKGKKHRLKLSEYSDNSTKITYITHKNGKHYFAVRHNKPVTKDTLSASYNYAVLSGTKYIKSGEITALHDSTLIEIKSDSLPHGIINLQLSDFNNKFVSEVFFFNNNKSISSRIHASSDENKINFSLNLENKSRLSASVICVYDTSYSENFFNSIKSNYELKSAQSIFGKGALNPKEKVTAKDISLAVLYPDSINKTVFTKKLEKFSNDSGINISGKITTQLFNVPLNNKKVMLFVMNKFNDVYSVMTNEKGEYSFKNLIYFDSLELSIESFKREGKHGYYLMLDEIEPIVSNVFTVNNIDNLKKGRKTQNLAYNYINKSEKTNSLHGTPNQVIDFDEINRGSYNNVLQVLYYYVPGISENNNSSIRGNNDFGGSSEPLYMIDDIPTNKDAIRSLSPQDVDRVEIIKSLSKSAIYGSRGSNGVIAVYTKTGEYAVIGRIYLVTEGFQSEKSRKAAFAQIPQGKEVSIFWNQNLITDDSGKVKINVNLPQGKYFYRIVIQGVDEKGNFIYLNKLFEH